jgi:copper chaperone
MATKKFKTDIKCSGCVAKVTPHLNAAVGENNWQVDINDPSKILTVTTDVDQSRVKAAVQQAGYNADEV